MNTKNNASNPPPKSDLIASQVDPFLADLKKAGYPDNTLCTKRAALRKFICWRRRRKNAGADPDESEVKAFMTKACQLTVAHRSLASTALFGFLKHLRLHGIQPDEQDRPFGHCLHSSAMAGGGHRGNGFRAGCTA